MFLGKPRPDSMCDWSFWILNETHTHLLLSSNKYLLISIKKSIGLFMVTRLNRPCFYCNRAQIRWAIGAFWILETRTDLLLSFNKQLLIGFNEPLAVFTMTPPNAPCSYGNYSQGRCVIGRFESVPRPTPTCYESLTVFTATPLSTAYFSQNHAQTTMQLMYDWPFWILNEARIHLLLSSNRPPSLPMTYLCKRSCQHNIYARHDTPHRYIYDGKYLLYW